MNWTLHNNSLHWKEGCSGCFGNKEVPVSQTEPEATHSHWKTCETCNGEGHAYTKVEAGKKPKVLYFNKLPMYTKEYNEMVIEWDEQQELIKELEEALRVERPELPYRFRLSSEIVKKSYRKELRSWLEAQETKSNFTLSKGKIKEAR